MVMNMWNESYAAEPVDLKLLLILFLRKIWIPVAAALAGAAVGAIGYMIPNVMFAKEPVFEAYSELYVDFLADEKGTYVYYTFNEAGWDSLVKTDEVLKLASGFLDGKYTVGELRDMVSANNQSDHRMLQLTTTAEDPGKALEAAHAMERALLQFAGEMREIDQIRLFSSAQEGHRIVVDNDTVRAAALGALLAFLAAVFVLVIYLVLDDSFYIPAAFEKRFAIPMLGIVGKELGKRYEEELQFEYRHLCGQYMKLLAVTSREELPELWKNDKKLEVYREYTTYEPDAPVLLFVKAGARNGRLIEKQIMDLRKNGLRIVAAVLTEADASILKQYYFGKSKKR